MKKQNLILTFACSFLILFSACKKETPPVDPNRCFTNTFTGYDAKALIDDSDSVLLALAAQGGIGHCLVKYEPDWNNGHLISENWTLINHCDDEGLGLSRTWNRTDAVAAVRAALIKGTCFQY